jgi:hypothetical protein
MHDDIAVAVDNGQEVIKVMGYFAGQLPDRFHLLRLAKLFLDMAMLGDILYHTNNADHLIFLIAKHLTL